MKKIQYSVSLALLLLIVACAPHRKQSVQAATLRTVGQDPRHAQVILYSLNPNRSKASGALFHGYGIVGESTIASHTDKRALLDTLATGIDNSQGSSHVCFKPRHGLHVVYNNQTTDYLICLQCLHMKVFQNGHVKNVTISNSPGPVYYGMLTKYHIPAPPK
ncbi:MAG: hypothetical protein ABIP97_10205 [Chthoniobacterales bacterium]